ncbi:MAG TPA: methyltransferase domain-containing protein, partial [Dermatophilaceae bacterium]
MSTTATAATALDVADLQRRVQAVYQQVAEEPRRAYHFELGRELALRLGYPTDLLDEVPAEALESFAGVGYFLDLAAPRAGERVLDLGSGSGTDSFAAATLVGPTGEVTGVDMTQAQLSKAERLRAAGSLEHVRFLEGRIEHLPVADACYDAVISNGVVNLSADKA